MKDHLTPAQHYVREGGMKRWDRATCSPLGLDLLLDWIAEYKHEVDRLEVHYDPGKTLAVTGDITVTYGPRDGEDATIVTTSPEKGATDDDGQREADSD
jgi:hypothetical protein